MDPKKVIRAQSGVIENTDTSGYQQYVVQRNLHNDVKNMKEQINMLLDKVAKLEKAQQ